MSIRHWGLTPGGNGNKAGDKHVVRTGRPCLTASVCASASRTVGVAVQSCRPLPKRSMAHDGETPAWYLGPDVPRSLADRVVLGASGAGSMTTWPARWPNASVVQVKRAQALGARRLSSQSPSRVRPEPMKLVPPRSEPARLRGVAVQRLRPAARPHLGHHGAGIVCRVPRRRSVKGTVAGRRRASLAVEAEAGASSRRADGVRDLKAAATMADAGTTAEQVITVRPGVPSARGAPC